MHHKFRNACVIILGVCASYMLESVHHILGVVHHNSTIVYIINLGVNASKLKNHNLRRERRETGSAGWGLVQSKNFLADILHF